MLLGVAAEVRERLLVRIEQFAERLAQTRHVDAPPREAERQHEDVPHLALRTQPDPRLAPINLALQTRGRLKSRPCHRRVQLHLPQRPNEPLHRFIAAAILPAPQLLVQNLRRVAHLRRTTPQIRRVRGQQRVRPRRALVRLPLLLPQQPAHCFPVKVQRASNRSNRCARPRSTTDLFPAVPSHHLDLPEQLMLGVDRPRCRRHLAPPLSYRGEEFSVTTGGDYWVTGDTRATLRLGRGGRGPRLGAADGPRQPVSVRPLPEPAPLLGGIHPSFAFVEEPETNGVVERWNRTLKEQAVYGRVFRNLAEVRAAVAAFPLCQ